MKEAAIIIGASSGLGRALAYAVAEKGFECILAARQERDLAMIAGDLREKFGSTAHVLPVDISTLSQQSAEEFAKTCLEKCSYLNQVYLTAAVIDDRDEGLDSVWVLDPITKVNYLGAARLVSAFAGQLKKTNANITVISSIAAIRPRSRNIAYAASKIALEYYVRGLQHYFSGQPVNFQIYRVGYMDTAMSFGKKLLLKKTDPAKVAGFIVKKRKSRKKMRYYPLFWSWISFALFCLPWVIYRKLKF